MNILMIQGPNLNLLGKRDAEVYGSVSLAQIQGHIDKKAKELGVVVTHFQSNSEGGIIDFLQGQAGQAQGVIINPGALTHYGLSLREALADTNLPVVEVHLSNIHARERWRRRSVVGDIAKAQISGLGWQGYLAALEYLSATLKES